MDRYRFLIGLYRCMIVLDGMRPYAQPARRFFANAPDRELADTLRGHQLDPENWQEYQSPYPAILIETGLHRVLIDAGAGPLTPDTGKLLTNLGGAGIQAEDIDTVILTHAHVDHVGGLINGDGQPAFPHAHYYIGKEEWDFWTGEPDLSSLAIPDEEKAMLVESARKNLMPLADRMIFVDREQEVVPGILAIPAPGHTPGHLAVAIYSQGSALLDIGDAALHPIGLEHPGWRSVFDMDWQEAEASLRMLLQRAYDDHMLVFGYHFCFPCLGHVMPAGDGFQWQPGEMEMAA
jgi:glyoxylase-like metal-dependent hydrolase (beta-lactamase superfamily II)